MIVLFDFDFERTFVEAGDSETRRGAGRKQPGPGSCWLAGKEGTVTGDRIEPKGAAADLLKSQRKGGLGDRFGDSPRMSCSCPLLRWLQVSRGPLEFTRCTPARGERRGRAWRGKRWQWVLKTLICYFSYIQLKFPPVLHIFLSGNILSYLVYPR